MLRLTQTEIRLLAQEIASLLPVPDEVLNLKQVAAMLDKSTDAVVKDAQRGLLPAHKRGKKYYFSKNELTTFLTNDEEAVRMF